MFFCPLVGSFIIFFRQLICRVVTIILLVSQFSDLLSRSFRSRSLLFQKFEDKPCSDNAACGAAYYTPKNFVRGHFIEFDGNQIYLPRLANSPTPHLSLQFGDFTSHAKPNRNRFLLQALYWWKCRP